MTPRPPARTEPTRGEATTRPIDPGGDGDGRGLRVIRRVGWRLPLFFAGCHTARGQKIAQ